LKFSAGHELLDVQNSMVMISEISRIGRRIIDVLNTVEVLHEMGISLYIQQFIMCSLENGKENPTVRLLIQILAIGVEVQNSIRNESQMQGIYIAKLNGKYINVMIVPIYL
jgi:DNA invertase Pin-like site-specific DNA recombinase